MKTFTKIICVFISIIILIGIYLYIKFPNLDPNIEVIEIHSQKYNETIFIKKKTWGLTGDSHLIVISNSSEVNFEKNEKNDYIFEDLTPLLYKFEKDTLTIYTMELAPFPDNMISNIRINQIKLTNSEMMELNKKYQEKGLKKIY